jgi:hypothetical protein
MKYCKDCRHYTHGGPYTRARCWWLPDVHESMVRGPLRVFATPTARRNDPDHCGPEARFFSPKVSLWLRIRAAFHSSGGAS